MKPPGGMAKSFISPFPMRRPLSRPMFASFTQRARRRSTRVAPACQVRNPPQRHCWLDPAESLRAVLEKLGGPWSTLWDQPLVQDCDRRSRSVDGLVSADSNEELWFGYVSKVMDCETYLYSHVSKVMYGEHVLILPCAMRCQMIYFYLSRITELQDCEGERSWGLVPCAVRIQNHMKRVHPPSSSSSHV